MTKGSRKCQVCNRQATGALVYRGYDFRQSRAFYYGTGAFLCQEDLEIATKTNLQRPRSAAELILDAAQRAAV